MFLGRSKHFSMGFGRYKNYSGQTAMHHSGQIWQSRTSYVRNKNKLLIVIGILGIFLLSAFLIGWDFQKTSEKDLVFATGTIRYIPLEGGFYGIETDEGEKYFPLNLKDELKKDGLRVWFKAKLKKIVTIQMWGRPIEILEFKIYKRIFRTGPSGD